MNDKYLRAQAEIARDIIARITLWTVNTFLNAQQPNESLIDIADDFSRRLEKAYLASTQPIRPRGACEVRE